MLGRQHGNGMIDKVDYFYALKIAGGSEFYGLDITLESSPFP